MSAVSEDAAQGALSAWFIRRPIATVLMTIAATLLGIVAYPLLSIAPLPVADFPTLQVNARLPGASPETMASAIATPLETAFSGVPGITEMTSTSAQGNTSITIQFALDRSIDGAAQEVQAAINSIAGRLPADMPALPAWKKQNPTDMPVINISVTSDTMPISTLSDIADTRMVRQLGQISGVSEINIMGQQRPSMRIRVQPDRLAAYGLTMADVRQAIRATNVNQAKGAVYGDVVSTLQTNDQLFTPGDYENIAVTYRNGAPVRVGDVAKVRILPENSYTSAFPNGKPGVMLNVQRQPGANIVDIVDAIRAELPRLTADLPPDIDVGIFNDRTRTIRASLAEVKLTLGITFVLVIVVMALFLRQVAATVIVAVVLAVSLVATLAAMYAMGFSINNLTLVALIIAVGFVVDDTIVVVENIHRHMEAGDGALAAALKGSREIGFTVVSIALSLVAAFIPLLFMGGVIGRLFREFSLTVTATLVISVTAALTLAPMLCARFMKPPARAAADAPATRHRITAFYGRLLSWALDRQRLVIGGFLATVVAAATAYVLIPKGFFPLQDVSYIMGTTIAAEDISYEDMKAKQLALGAVIAKDPDVAQYTVGVGTSAGSSTLSTGRMWIVLKDRSERASSSEEIIARLRPQLAAVTGVSVALRSQQDINLGAKGGASQYSYVLRSPDQGELSLWSDRLTQAIAASPLFRDVTNDLQLGARMQAITIDRAAASRLGLSVDAINQALYDSFGQRQIGEFQTQLNQYRIVLEVDPAHYSRVGTLNSMFLRSPTTGAMVPLAAVTKLEPQASGPLTISRSGLLPAVNISFNLPKGVALGDAIATVNRLKEELGMPATVVGGTQGAALAFEQSLATQPLLILAAIVAVYIILGILYESFRTPLVILSSLPSAGLGAVLLLWLWRLDFSIMALIGIILLIGIVMKNGILMVDFALDAQRRRGLDARQAITEAAVTRFRPILMTTIATLLAAVPLVLAFGTGAELRQPLGVAIVGGLVISQLLTLFSTPAVYIAIDRLFHRRADGPSRIKLLLEGARPA